MQHFLRLFKNFVIISAIVIGVFLIGKQAFAEYTFNPFTNKLDFYLSSSTIGISTGASSVTGTPTQVAYFGSDGKLTSEDGLVWNDGLTASTSWGSYFKMTDDGLGVYGYTNNRIEFLDSTGDQTGTYVMDTHYAPPTVLDDLDTYVSSSLATRIRQTTRNGIANTNAMFILSNTSYTHAATVATAYGLQVHTTQPYGLAVVASTSTINAPVLVIRDDAYSYVDPSDGTTEWSEISWAGSYDGIAQPILNTAYKYPFGLGSWGRMQMYFATTTDTRICIGYECRDPQSTLDVRGDIAFSNGLIGNFTTSTYNLGRFYVSSSGDIYSSGTLKVAGLTNLDGGLLTTSSTLGYLTVTSTLCVGLNVLGNPDCITTIGQLARIGSNNTFTAENTFSATTTFSATSSFASAILDKNGSAGTSGQLLSSLGNGVDWIDGVSLSGNNTWTGLNTFTNTTTLTNTVVSSSVVIGNDSTLCSVRETVGGATERLTFNLDGNTLPKGTVVEPAIPVSYLSGASVDFFDRISFPDVSQDNFTMWWEKVGQMLPNFATTTFYSAFPTSTANAIAIATTTDIYSQNYWLKVTPLNNSNVSGTIYVTTMFSMTTQLANAGTYIVLPRPCSVKKATMSSLNKIGCLASDMAPSSTAYTTIGGIGECLVSPTSQGVPAGYFLQTGGTAGLLDVASYTDKATKPVPANDQQMGWAMNGCAGDGVTAILCKVKLQFK